MRYIDLFGGIGGFRYGIEQATKKKENDKEWNGTSNNAIERRESYLHRNWQCVYYADIDKYATAVYNHNFNETWKPTDITQARPESIPEADLICGGFPCQSFSLAGKRKGFEDTRGTLYHEILRIARAKRIKYLFLENVKGLLNHDEGATFSTILQSLDESGYDAQWQVLNSKWWIPQNRERVFIIATLRGESEPKVFPIGSNDKEADENRTSVRTLTAGAHSGGLHSQSTGIAMASGNSRAHESIRLDEAPAIDHHAPILLDDTYSYGLRTYTDSPALRQSRQGLKVIVPTIRAEHHNTADVHYIVQPVLTPDRAEKRQNGRRFKNAGEEMFTLTGQDRHGDSMADKIRRLTPIECERLQGFPDNWTNVGNPSIAKRYNALGRSMTVPVMKWLGKQIGNEFYGEEECLISHQ